MKKLMSAIVLLSLSTSSYAAVYSSFDSKNNCTLYRVLNSSSDTQPEANESLEIKNDVYGLSFQDLAIDFNKRQAEVKIMVHVALGFNRYIGPSPTIIPGKNPNFNTLINFTNRRVNVLQKICINRNDQIVYADTEK